MKGDNLYTGPVKINLVVRRLQWLSLLVSIGLLSSQAIAQQHFHVDDFQSGLACVVCAHADTTPDLPTMAVARPPALLTIAFFPRRLIAKTADYCDCYLARGPPKN